jgi:hypothetical protein
VTILAMTKIPKEIEAIVNESGNTFHCKVANSFKAKGWEILVSPYYMDGGSNKPREIDLIAEKRWTHPVDEFRKEIFTVSMRLFIECKYIPQPTVFWFADKDKISATALVASTTPLKKHDRLFYDHHYLAESHKVAKMFASKNMPSLDNEVMYKALNQSLNAMIYLRGGQSLLPAINTTYKQKSALVEMPVVVCNSFDDFYKVDMTDAGAPLKIDKNFQLEVNYAYVGDGVISFPAQRSKMSSFASSSRRNEYFLLDIINLKSMDDYLNILRHDTEAIMHTLARC